MRPSRDDQQNSHRLANSPSRHRQPSTAEAAPGENHPPGISSRLSRCTLVIVLKRKSIAVVVLALFAGLAPLTAAVFFCTEAPCCIGDAETHASMSRPRADCCAPVSCYEPPAQKLPKDTSLQTFPTEGDVSFLALSGSPRIAKDAHPIESASPPRSRA